MLPLLLGALTTAGVILVVVLVAALTGYYLHSFSLVFVIPVGGLAAGVGCGAGVFFGLITQGRRPQVAAYVLSGALGLAGFAGVYAALYATTYVGPDGKLNHTFKGEHISHYTYKDTGEPVTFAGYLVREIRNRESTFFVGSRRVQFPVGAFHMPSVYNWAKFGLEGVGFLVGSSLVGFLILSDRRYCARCERYMTDQDLFHVLPTQVGDMISRLSAALRSGHDLRALIDEQPGTPSRNEGHFRVALSYCATCYEGFLLIKAMRKTDDGYEEAREHRQTMQVSGTVVRDVVVPVGGTRLG